MKMPYKDYQDKLNWQRHYETTNAGKQAQHKYNTSKKGLHRTKKCRARRRKLGFTKVKPNIFSESEPVDWHHIDDEHVVAMPRWLHNLYGGSRKIHRSNLRIYVKQFYGI